MKKIILLIIVIILSGIFVFYRIDEYESKQMNDLFKNNDIEILDSINIGKSEVCFIYQNSQMISGSDTKFLVISDKSSCELKKNDILLQSSDILQFYKMEKDSLMVFSALNFQPKRLANGLILVRVDSNTDKGRMILSKKNIHPIVIHCE